MDSVGPWLILLIAVVFAIAFWALILLVLARFAIYIWRVVTRRRAKEGGHPSGEREARQIRSASKPMRPSLLWGLRVGGGLLAFVAVGGVVAAIAAGESGYALAIVINFLPACVVFGMLTVGLVEVIGSFRSVKP